MSASSPPSARSATSSEVGLSSCYFVVLVKIKNDEKLQDVLFTDSSNEAKYNGCMNCELM